MNAEPYCHLMLPSTEDLQEDFELNIWTTDDKRKIHLKDMTEGHIRNCINHIQRNGGNAAFGYGAEWLPKLRKELVRRNRLPRYTL